LSLTQKLGKLAIYGWALDKKLGKKTGLQRLAMSDTPRFQTKTPTLKDFSKDQLRYIIDNLPQFFWLHDLEGNITDVNLSWYRAAGFSDPSFRIGKKIKEGMPKKYRDRFDDYLEQILANGTANGLLSFLTEQGDERIYEYNSILLYDSAGAPAAVASFGKDITDQKKTERKLQKSEQKYRTILKTIEEGYYEVDLGGHLTFFNPSLSQIIGFTEEEMAGMSYKKFTDQETIEKIYKTFNNVFRTREPTKTFDWKLIRKDGTECTVETSISPILDKNEAVVGFRGICHDITERIEAEKERQNLENQLFYTQKMEALGTLAGGFAHNFNNILFPLIGYIDMALMRMEKDAPYRRYLEKAQDSANKAKQMIQRVQEYTRNDENSQLIPVDLSEVVDGAIKVFKASISRKVNLNLNQENGCPTVLIDPSQIQQMVFNLLTNANDAIMANSEAGDITVTVATEEIDAAHPKINSFLSTGRYGCISITDSGGGIDPEIVDRVFDPFFTTKAETGKGLGLSLSHRIVKKYGGEIFIESQTDRKTTVYVYLPEKPKDRPSEIPA